MNLTNRQLIAYRIMLLNERKNTDSFYIKNVFSKNADLIEKETQSILDLEKEAKLIMVNHDTKLNELIADYIQKDEKGNDVYSDEAKTHRILIKGSEELVEKIVKDLKEEFKDDISNFEAKIKEINEILDETPDIKFYKIKENKVPENITEELFNVLYPILENEL